MAYKFPNAHSRVRYLLDSIQNNDPGLQAVMAPICASKGAYGLRSDFEMKIYHTLLYFPVTKRITSVTKFGIGKISTVNGAEEVNVSFFGTKFGQGPKTGVQL